MGLLDEAIREHLDLKRRRGADPAEIEKAEREALGPVRRGPEEPPPAEAEVQEPLAYDHESEEDWDGSFDQEGDHYAPLGPDEPFADDRTRVIGATGAEAEAPVEEEEEPLPHEDSLTRHEPPPPPAEEWDEEDPFDDDDPFAEPAAETPTPHPAPAAETPAPHPAPAAEDHLSQETAEYQVQAEPPPGEKKGEDVLEETPEFLQDTPDHDRLWFEQRPPRDFDFDK